MSKIASEHIICIEDIALIWIIATTRYSHMYYYFVIIKSYTEQK